MRHNLIGHQNRLFAEPAAGADETVFQVDNTSAAYYNSPYYALHKNDVLPWPPPRATPPRMNLADVLGSDLIQAITTAGKIAFHAVGDTGAAKVTHQTVATAIAHQARLADALQAAAAPGTPT